MADEIQPDGDGSEVVAVEGTESAAATVVVEEPVASLTGDDSPESDAEPVAVEAPAEVVADEESAAPAPPAPPLSAIDAEFTPVATAITPRREVEGYEYEIMYILDPGTDAGQVEEVSNRSRQTIEDGDGALDNVRTSQVRRMAFSIKGQREGIYVVLNLRCQPPVVAELERQLKLDERVLRYMVIRLNRD